MRDIQNSSSRTEIQSHVTSSAPWQEAGSHLVHTNQTPSGLDEECLSLDRWGQHI